MKTTRVVGMALIVLALMPFDATAAISIKSGLNGPFYFDVAPTAADGWTTGAQPPTGTQSTGNNIINAAAMDANVATLVAPSTQLSSNLPTTATINPPSTHQWFRYNNSGRYLQSRVTGSEYSILLATLRNDASTAIGLLTISYTQGNIVATTPVAEQIPGFRVYWSLTGAPNSWQVIPELSSAPNGQVSATIMVNSWAAGQSLYLLWVDDNANPGTDDAWTLDDISFEAITASGPLSIVNPNLPQNLVVEEYQPAAFSFAVSGAAPAYQWYKDGLPLPGSNAATYTISNAAPANAGAYQCVATNSLNSVTSRVATLTVQPDTLRPMVQNILTSSDMSRLTVVFSEAVAENTATNPAQYTLSGPEPLPTVVGARLTGTNTVELQLSQPRAYAVAYSLTVREVQDRAQTANVMVTQTEPVPTEYKVPIFPMSHVWRYNTNGINLGSAWKETAYNHSTWPAGPGILGYENTSATLAAYGAAGESLRTSFGLVYPGTPTYYFRTTFTNTSTMPGLGLVAEGFFDDGAIFWLNGVEIGRFANPGTWPVGPVTFDTLVTEDTAPEGTLWTVALNGTPMQQGVNVLAVEMHQNSLTSSDIIMGFRLYQLLPSTLAITVQPVGTNIMENQSFSLSVTNTGAPAYYQWYRDGAAVAGANAATYAVADASTNHTGYYYVAITNGASAVTSAVVFVNVQQDVIAPFIAYAVMQTNGYNTSYGDVCAVNLQFSEPVNTNDAMVLRNYLLVREGDSTNNALAIYSANLDVTGTNLTLVCAPKQEAPPVNYRLLAANIRDLARVPNTMPLTTNYPHLRFFAIKSISQVWRYDASGAELGADWTSPAFNDSAWSYTKSPFGDANYETVVPGAGSWGGLSAYLPVSNTITSYYYRTTFNLPTDPMGVRLQFEIWADDGAVFYLNGVEARNVGANPNTDPGGRYYMTNGTEIVRATTQAQNHTAGTPSQRALRYPINLRSGTNTLAASVHQNFSGTLDHAFALQVIATVPPLNRSLPPSLLAQPLDIGTHAGGDVTFTADGEGSLPLTARWYHNETTLIQSTIIPAGTPLTDLPVLLALTRTNVQSADSGAYTLVLSNAAGMVTSRVAILYVNPGSVKPILLRVVGSGNNEHITIEFDGVVHPDLASTPSNFRFTPGLGVLNAVRTNQGTAVWLTTERQNPNTVYNIEINISDLMGNVLVTNVSFRPWVPNVSGGLPFEVYNNIGISMEVSALTLHPTFPDSPSQIFVLPSFDTTTIWPATYPASNAPERDGYGARIRGLFIPPLSGPWRFFILSDDNSELWINTNGASASGKTLIAWESQWGYNFQEPGIATQTSPPYQLIAGQPYYLEALYKEGEAGDYCKVAARMEGDTTVATNLPPLSFQMGYPYIPAGISGEPIILQQPTNTVVEMPAIQVVSVLASNSLGLPLVYQWQRNDGTETFTNIPNARLKVLTLPGLTAADSHLQFRCLVASGDASATSAVATVTVIGDKTGPSLLTAVRAANQTSLLLTFSEPLAQPGATALENYRVCDVFNSASCVQVLNVVLTNNDTAVLLETSAPNPAGIYQVTVDRVADTNANVILPPNTMVLSVSTVFQQGINGYTGTSDTQIMQGNPTNNYGSQLTLLVDYFDSGGAVQGLLAFQNLFGSDPNQIPPDATITSANLRLYSITAGANSIGTISFHLMLTNWDASTIAWSSIGNGVQMDNVEATAAADGLIVPDFADPRGTAWAFRDLDVTASVLSWASGQRNNYGWLLNNSSTDGYRFSSSDDTNALYRPQLTIAYQPVWTNSPVKILSHPGSTNVMAGQTAVFTVVATGTLPLYQWLFNGERLPGANSATLVIPDVRLAQAGDYSVVITNNLGSITSLVAKLVVEEVPRITFTRQPSNAVVRAGESHSFSVFADGNPPLSYRWYFNESTVLHNQTNAMLVFTNVQFTHAGLYYVVVSNSAGSITSAVVRLSVVWPETNALRIVSFGTNGVVAIDHNNLTGDDSGGIAVSSQRVFITGDTSTAHYNADNLAGGARVGSGLVLDGLIANLRTETVYSLANGTNYLRRYSYYTVDGLLELNPATGLRNGNRIPLSQAISIYAYGCAVFSGCDRAAIWNGQRLYVISLPSGSVADLGPLAITNYYSSENWAFWGVIEYFNDSLHLVYVRDSQTIVRTTVATGQTTILQSFENLGDMASITLSLSRQRWYFHHESSSQFRQLSGETLGHLPVVFDNGPQLPPAITLQPISTAAPLGGVHTLSVAAGGSLPLRFQWYFNDTTLLPGQTNATLTLTNIELNQDGFYSVVVANSLGSVTSSLARLTVIPAPRITRQPQGVTTGVGGTAAFSVQADGEAPLAYQWRKDGAAIPGATDNRYTLTNIQYADAGAYQVVITNVWGARTSAVAALTVTNKWLVTTFAGSGIAGHHNVPDILAAQFNNPNGIAYSSYYGVFVADGSNQRIRLINVAGVNDWAGSGVAGSQLGSGATAQFQYPLGLAVDAYNQLFIADTGNNRMLRVNPVGSRTVALLAGSGQPGLINGTGPNAYFNYPVDCALDAAGNLYVAEFNNHVIRRVTPFGEVTVLAGTGAPGTNDGPAAVARFISPAGVATDTQGNFYVTDWDGHCVRKIDTNGMVSTLAGSGVAGFRDGLGAQAQFTRPDGICVDARGNLYVVENGNHCVRRITPAGEVTTVAGTGAAGYQDGPGNLARFNGPGGICALPDGSLLISDTANNRIRKLQYLASPPCVAAQTGYLRLLEGDTLELSAWVTGEPPISLQWYFDGAPMLNANDTSLVIANAATNQSGWYWLGLSNEVGTVTGWPISVRVGKAHFDNPTAAETAQLTSVGMTLKLELMPGGNFEIQYKNDLAEPGWQTLTNFTPSARLNEFLDPQAVHHPRRFYRLIKLE